MHFVQVNILMYIQLANKCTILIVYYYLTAATCFDVCTS
jgi:hypothetical protein